MSCERPCLFAESVLSASNPACRHHLGSIRRLLCPAKLSDFLTLHKSFPEAFCAPSFPRSFAGEAAEPTAPLFLPITLHSHGSERAALDRCLHGCHASIRRPQFQIIGVSLSGDRRPLPLHSQDDGYRGRSEDPPGHASQATCAFNQWSGVFRKLLKQTTGRLQKKRRTKRLKLKGFVQLG